MHKRFLMLLTAACCLLGAGMAAEKPAKPKTEVGRLMCVGDSLTHGTGTYSYRWYLHKILVDNGIPYEAAGYHTGSWNYDFTPAYGDPSAKGYTAYTNTHSSRYNAKVTEFIDGSQQLDQTKMDNWLGFSDKKADGSAYTGPVYCKAKGNPVDTFVVMLGTNDFNQQNFDPKQIGDNLHKLVDKMQRSAPKARVYVLSIPVYGAYNGRLKNRRADVVKYNDTLKAWASKTKNVTYVDINKGWRDLSSQTPHLAVPSMVAADKLHLTPQADLIIAGNLANAMGLPGATAGLPRKAAAKFPQSCADAMEAAWNKSPSGGFSADFSFCVSKDGAPLEVTLGNGSVSGTLVISETFISWGGTVLYAEDMSTLCRKDGAVRFVYSEGAVEQGRPAGFYVWVGGTMIGEALPAQEGATGGAFAVKGGSVSGLRLDPSGAYAPARSKKK